MADPAAPATPSTGDPRGPHAGDVWQHIRSGQDYLVLGIVWLEATNEPAVRYTRTEGTGPEWVRSVVDWFADNGDGVTRFALVMRS